MTELSKKEKTMIIAGIGIAGAVGVYLAYKVSAKPEEDCTEGAVKKYTCPDGTEITTHICEDGKWIETGEICPNGNGCTEGWLDEERCVGTTLQRKYQFADCSTEWRDVEVNSLECGACIEGFLDEWRCVGTTLQQAYQRSDCSIEWRVVKENSVDCIGYCRLYGNVVDQEGYAVPYALISLVGRTTGKTYTQHTGTAGWAGNFDFERILVDIYDIYITKTGYIDSSYVESGLTRDKEHERTYVLARKAQFSRLYGKIIDQFGKPVAFAMIQLRMHPTGYPEYLQMAGANGNFDFHKVDCGVYKVYIGNTPGYKNVQYDEDLSTAGEYYNEYIMEKL